MVGRKEKRILIAGGSGLIGRALAVRLADDGYKVRAVGVSQEVEFEHGRIEYLKRDLKNPSAIVDLLGGVETVVFCAGRAGGRGQFKARASEMAIDACLMNSNLLNACIGTSVRRILVVASATMYPPKGGPIGEDDLDLNRDPAPAYRGLGWSWRYIEKLARWLGEAHAMEVVVLRTSNVFGPYCRFDPDFSNFIPALVRKSVASSDPFEVYGSPRVTRDVLFVDDFVEAVMKLLEKRALGIQSFNIGSGYPTRVGEVVDWALKYAQHSPRGGVVYSDPTDEPPKSSYLDCARLKAFIDWSPAASAERGVSELVAWWQKNRESWTR